MKEIRSGIMKSQADYYILMIRYNCLVHATISTVKMLCKGVIIKHSCQHIMVIAQKVNNMLVQIGILGLYMGLIITIIIFLRSILGLCISSIMTNNTLVLSILCLCMDLIMTNNMLVLSIMCLCMA